MNGARGLETMRRLEGRLWSPARSSASPSLHLRGCRPSERCFLDRGADARIGAAATDVAAHRRVDILVGGIRGRRHERGGRHDLARLTIAALRHVELNPGCLQPPSKLLAASLQLDGRPLLRWL